MQSILGIDISKDTFDVVLLSENGKHHKVFDNNPKGFISLEKWLIASQAEQVHACMEATGQSGDGVAEYLYERDLFVSVVNPVRIKHYGESKLHRNKNDKASADLIAEFCQKEKPAFWKPLNPETKHLRALVRRLTDLKTNRQQEINRMKSGEKDTWVMNDLQAHIDYLNHHIKATEKEIKEFVD
jgi:transposase